MQVDLFSGVVRNRKVAAVTVEQERESKRFLSFDSDGESGAQEGFWYTVRDYLSGSALFRNLNLRVHRFVFQWNLIMHLSIGTFSYTFFFVGDNFSCIPLPCGPSTTNSNPYTTSREAHLEFWQGKSNV